MFPCSGLATYISADGHTIVGNYVDGLLEGHVCEFVSKSNALVFDGIYRNNVRNGWGKLILQVYQTIAVLYLSVYDVSGRMAEYSKESSSMENSQGKIIFITIQTHCPNVVLFEVNGDEAR